MSHVQVPRLVLVGSTGSGKSTVMEKVTGLTNLSSDEAFSFTKCALPHESRCGKLVLTDTPGGDSLGDSVTERLHTSMYIAQALAVRPVSLILVVVPAGRIDAMVKEARPYVETFLSFAENIAILATKMDTVKWKPADFPLLPKKMEEQLGVRLLIQSRLETTGEEIVAGLLGLCAKVAKPVDITIDSKNFLNFFNIRDEDLAILATTKRETNTFAQCVRDFEEQLMKLPEADRPDAVFEFHKFAVEEITRAQARVSDEHHLRDQFLQRDKAANAAGHVAHIMSRLKHELASVRRMARRYQAEALDGPGGKSDLRKCPHCGLVWARLAGCHQTSCGNMMNAPDARRGQMATFSFTIRGEGEVPRLKMVQVGNTQIAKALSTKPHVGCGNTLDWNMMAPVQVPAEFTVKDPQVTTDDVPTFRPAEESTWQGLFGAEWATAMQNQKLMQEAILGGGA